MNLPKSAVIVCDGKPVFTIVTSAEPSKATRDAVHELNYWISRITGVALPVMTTDQWEGTTRYIAVGPSKLAAENRWDTGPMKQEEARVFVETDRIGLIGNDQSPYEGVSWTGTYYAVLELVQKELGVRWIWPGKSGEVFTCRPTLTLNTKSWTWAPDLTMMRVMVNGFRSARTDDLAERYFDYFNVKQGAREAQKTMAADQQTWLKRQRMNQSSHVKFGHSFTNWWERFGEKHPDWFAKPPAGVTQHGGKGVKLNLSNPEVHDQIISDWKSKWDNNPSQNKVIPVGPNDSRGFDTRPETRAWDARELQKYSDAEIYSSPEPVLTDRYVKFWNILARRVAAIDPEAIITTFAYRNYQAPPLGDERVEPNVLIAYVGGEGYYPDERHIVDEWKGWKSKGATLTWRPNLLHTGHGTPYLFSRTLFNDFNFFRKHGLAGTSFDTLVGNWAGQGLTYYVLAEQHSRRDATYDELASEYFDAFGPAAESIQAFHEYFEERTGRMPQVLRESGLVPRETWGGWWTGHIRIMPLFLTPDVVNDANHLLSKAKNAVADSDPKFRTRVDFIDVGFQHAALMATTFRQLKLHKPDSYGPDDHLSSQEKRDILTPLWEFRQDLPPDCLIPVTRYLTAEEKHLGIWQPFRIDQRGPGSFSTQVPSTHGVPGPSRDGLHDTDTTVIRHQIDQRWRVDRDPDNKQTISYQFQLDVPELSDTGGRVFLYFELIDWSKPVIRMEQATTRLWINERLVYNKGNAGLFQGRIDISNAVKSGAENDLKMQVGAEFNLSLAGVNMVLLIEE